MARHSSTDQKISPTEARLALEGRPPKETKCKYTQATLPEMTHAVSHICVVLRFSNGLSATLFPGMTVHGRAETPKPASG